jgi:hypothetical protein
MNKKYEKLKTKNRELPIFVFCICFWGRDRCEALYLMKVGWLGRDKKFIVTKVQ